MSFEKSISLDPRLSMIAEMLGVCECCADIGSDHGRLGAFLLQTGQCRSMVMTDISEPSLEKARKLIALLGLSEKVCFCVGDGALALSQPVDAAVIAGMGGETIASILENSGNRLDGATLILQPNVAAPELRRRMTQQGWQIADERLARDGRRIYPVLKAVQGTARLNEAELAVGPVLLKTRPPELADYAAFRLRVLRKALTGAAAGSDTAACAEIRREIGIWEAVETCL